MDRAVRIDERGCSKMRTPSSFDEFLLFEKHISRQIKLAERPNYSGRSSVSLTDTFAVSPV